MRKEYTISKSNFSSSFRQALLDFINTYINPYYNNLDFFEHIYEYTNVTAGLFPNYSVQSYDLVCLELPYATDDGSRLWANFIIYNDRVGLFCTREMANDVQEDGLFNLDGVILNGCYANTTYDGGWKGSQSVIYNTNFAYYIPMPTIGCCDKLVINWDKASGTLMLSGLTLINYASFGTQYLTHSICLGGIEQRGSWCNKPIWRTVENDGVEEDEFIAGDGGFWYGGDAVCQLELYFRCHVLTPRPTAYHYDEEGKLLSTTQYYNETSFFASGLCWQFESSSNKAIDNHLRQTLCSGSNYTWYDNPSSMWRAGLGAKRLPNTRDNFNRFECFLMIDMDDYPIRGKNDIISLTGDLSAPGFPNYINYCPYVVTSARTGQKTSGAYGTPMPTIGNKRKSWATTLKLSKSYYVPMLISVDDIESGLPSYWSLFSSSQFDIGHTVNDLNSISVILHLYFMVHRDPQELNNYSCVGYTDVVNYVNMKNMSTNRILNGTYPVKLDYYNCFQIGVRRSDIGFKGYAGLAFKLEDGDVVEQENVEEQEDEQEEQQEEQNNEES